MNSIRAAVGRLVASGVHADTPPVEARHIRATNTVALIGAASIGAWVPMAAAAGHPLVAAQNALASLGFLGGLALERRGHHGGAVSLVLCVGTVQILGATLAFGVASGSSLFLLPAATLPYLMFHRHQRHLAHGYSVLAAVCAVLSVAFRDHLPMRLPLVDPGFMALFNTTSTLTGLVVVAAAFAGIVDRSEDALKDEHAKVEALLLNVLPEPIARRLQAAPDQGIFDHFDDVSVLFADIVGFTPLSARVSAARTVSLLNEIFATFDAFCAEEGVERIKTIGDGYMAVAGAPEPCTDHALRLARVAVRMRDWMASDPTGEGLQLRLGLNSGDAVAGIVGRSRFHYDLWSDTVNTAARMESHGEAGRIQISRATWEHIRDEFQCEPRGTVEVKGKGPMETWFIA